MTEKKRRRPPKREMPERIDATPEEIAEAVLRFRPPPPGEWEYQQKDKKGKN